MRLALFGRIARLLLTGGNNSDIIPPVNSVEGKEYPLSRRREGPFWWEASRGQAEKVVPELRG